MFGISLEHLLLLGVVLLIFGPRRLPELGHTLGKAIRNFKEALSGVEEARFKKLESPSSVKESEQAALQVAARSTEASVPTSRSSELTS